MTNAPDPIALAQALIRCESVTPKEAGALTVLQDVLARDDYVLSGLVDLDYLEREGLSKINAPFAAAFKIYLRIRTKASHAAHRDLEAAFDFAFHLSVYRQSGFTGGLDRLKLNGRIAIDQGRQLPDAILHRQKEGLYILTFLYAQRTIFFPELCQVNNSFAFSADINIHKIP